MISLGLSMGFGVVLLYCGGESLVRGAEALALRLGITPLLVGLTVVAFATSTPELFVSVSAVLQQLDDVAIGNIVGSNICNIALVLGLAAVVRPIDVKARLVWADTPIMIICAGILAVVVHDGVVTRREGGGLVGGIVLYLAFSWWRSRYERGEVGQQFADTTQGRVPRAGRGLLYVFVGLVMLVVGAEFFILGAVGVASEIGISDVVIGLTLVAVGTSLPELATSIVASAKGRGDIVVGNAVGSCIFNTLAVLGMTALVHPLARGDLAWVDIAVMAAIAVLLWPMLYSRRRLSRREGAVLLVCYAAYIGYLAVRA